MNDEFRRVFTVRTVPVALLCMLLVGALHLWWTEAQPGALDRDLAELLPTTSWFFVLATFLLGAVIGANRSESSTAQAVVAKLTVAAVVALAVTLPTLVGIIAVGRYLEGPAEPGQMRTMAYYDGTVYAAVVWSAVLGVLTAWLGVGAVLGLRRRA